MTNKFNVLPCPFCGHDATAELMPPEPGFDAFAVQCPKCWAQGPLAKIADDEDIEDAMKRAALMWNGREWP